MKKRISLLLIIAMSISLLVGCGGSGDENVDSGNDSSVNQGSSANQNIMNQNNVTQDNATQEDDGGSDETTTNISEEQQSHIVSGESVLYENDYITIEISGIERSSVSCSVNITASNKTDQTLGIYPEKWFINGYCVKADSFGYIEIGPNEESVISEITLPIEKLEAIGISNVGEIVLQCDLRDASESMLGDNVINSTLIGYQTSDYVNMDTEMSFELYEVADCEGIKLYAAIVPDGFYSWSNTSIVFVAENAGSETVNIQLADESDDVAIRSLTGLVANGETFILGLWGTDSISTGDGVKLFVTLLDESMQQVLVDGQEFEWTAK